MPAEVRPGHCGVHPSPIAAVLGGVWGGEASSASGKQSGLNWSPAGLTCLHLLEETEETEDPAARLQAQAFPASSA